jgi:aminocarboxymuconate-semialdehyde decarboxylase
MWRSPARPRSPGRISTWPLCRWAAFSTDETKALMAKQEADIRDGMRATDVRFKTMDNMGVDMQLVCPAPPQIYYTVPLEIGVQANHIINDGIAEYVGKHPDRLVALGGVPMQDWQ